MVNLLGLHLQLMIGGTVPVPAPLSVLEALESVEVTHQDEGRSGFQIVFQVGRGLADRKDFALLKESRLRPFNRVVLSVLFGLAPKPIMDGLVTTHQLAPSDEPGASRLTVTGEDLSVAMDLEKGARPYPQLGHDLIVGAILLPYIARYAVIAPNVTRPDDPLSHPVDERTTTQTKNQSDLEYIKELAGKHGFVFYVEPGALPLSNIAYWGPPQRRELPQPALSVNMGSNTNIETISFKYDELAPKRIVFADSAGTDQTVSGYSRQPALAARVPQAHRLDFLSGAPDGASDAEKRVLAQGLVNTSYDQVVSADGTLNALHYGRILKPRSLVDLRGAGDHFDGRYYVKTVTHSINVRKGEYKQKFKLTREGVGTTTPIVTI